MANSDSSVGLKTISFDSKLDKVICSPAHGVLPLKIVVERIRNDKLSIFGIESNLKTVIRHSSGMSEQECEVLLMKPRGKSNKDSARKMMVDRKFIRKNVVSLSHNHSIEEISTSNVYRSSLDTAEFNKSTQSSGLKNVESVKKGSGSRKSYLVRGKSVDSRGRSVGSDYTFVNENFLRTRLPYSIVNLGHFSDQKIYEDADCNISLVKLAEGLTLFNTIINPILYGYKSYISNQIKYYF
uniref:DNA (cytosine-5-)-methyltransferase n=1 Tax=Rhabditophanes sp. KR3021 TaxID=114890 RepID=A0AC35UF77_9BILA